MDKEFKDLRDKIGKIWEAEEQQLSDTQIWMRDEDGIPKAFKVFTSYGYFNMLDKLKSMSDLIYFDDDSNFYPHIKFSETSMVINLSKLDIILEIILKNPEPPTPNEHHDLEQFNLQRSDFDMALQLFNEIQYQFKIQSEYFPKFIDDLKKAVEIIGGPKEFKKFYDDKNREDSG